ncbi:lipopolysaccharide biosynthesis protein [Flagellimonas sp. CMM7]|uniref:lipopolysaccharide biosynthesis protein n=1 Tax=Flagellimonas sp. CMM7 TaxID=2654676 RepID=UPI0013D2FC1A|nr:sugar transporter [Flagellimonas sp. CMM7]UII79910.1 hypothetical protein LV704_19910 [Flagellimonas sp. CMM7]
MSRIAKSIKNAKVGVIFFSLSLIAQFFSRKIFLQYLGDDFIGLTSTLRNILGFLNLAELGIGTAVGYSLYKPIYDKNRDEIKKILSLLAYIYKKVGLIILALGLLVSLSFPFIFEDTPFSHSLIFFVFYVALTSNLFGYFFNYYMVLLEADQKGYIVQGYFQSSNIIRIILQSLIAYYLQNFYLWIAMDLIFGLAYTIILRIKINKNYPWLLSEMPKSNIGLIKQYPDIVKRIKQVFIHKLSAFVKDGTDNILIYALVNLQSVAFFGNYQLIFSKLTALIKISLAGTEAGVGNLIAENDEKNIKKVFWEMMAMYFYIGGLLSIVLYHSMNLLITLWVGQKYVLDNYILLVMLIIFFISQIRKPVDMFKNAHGLYSDTWAPATQIVINLGFSFFLGKAWGIVGVMCGTLISMLFIICLWRPYFLFKHGFKKNVVTYWTGIAPFLIIFFSVAFAMGYLIEIINYYGNESFLGLIVFLAFIFFTTAIIYGLLLYVCTKGFKDIFHRFKNLLFKKIKKQ